MNIYIYMTQPLGFHDKSNRVCKLKWSPYGLKQTASCWYQQFINFLKRFNFIKSDADPCLFIKIENGHQIIVVLYVDDGLVASTSQDNLNILFDKFIRKNSK